VISQYTQIRRQPNFDHRGLQSLSPRYCRLQMQRTSDKRDASVPQGGEMLYSRTNSVLIVDPDIGDSSDMGSYVDEYQRDTPETKVFEQT